MFDLKTYIKNTIHTRKGMELSIRELEWTSSSHDVPSTFTSSPYYNWTTEVKTVAQVHVVHSGKTEIITQVSCG